MAVKRKWVKARADSMKIVAGMTTKLTKNVAVALPKKIKVSIF